MTRLARFRAAWIALAAGALLLLTACGGGGSGGGSVSRGTGGLDCVVQQGWQNGGVYCLYDGPDYTIRGLVMQEPSQVETLRAFEIVSKSGQVPAFDYWVQQGGERGSTAIMTANCTGSSGRAAGDFVSDSILHENQSGNEISFPVCADELDEGPETIVLILLFGSKQIRVAAVITNHGTAQKAAMKDIAGRVGGHVLGVTRPRATAKQSGAWLVYTPDAQSAGGDYHAGAYTVGAGVTRASFKGSAGLPYHASLWVLHPYAAWHPDKQWALWGVGGFGKGQFKAKWQGYTHKPDLQFWTVGGGVDYAAVNEGPVTLNVGAEGFYAEAKSETSRKNATANCAADGEPVRPCGNFMGATGAARGLRGYGSVSVQIGPVTPSLEAGWAPDIGFDATAEIEADIANVKPSASVNYADGDVGFALGLTVGF